jgi:hypothetical protein
MNSTFFPIDENSFIENIMYKIKELKDIDNWYDVFHTDIDNQTSYNSDDENVMIIKEYAGGIYEAIELYQDHFGEFNIPENKFKFYGQLSFISIYVKFYDTIQKEIDEIKEGKSKKKYHNNKDNVICKCGCEIRKNYLSKHLKTQKHLKLMSQK